MGPTLGPELTNPPAILSFVPSVVLVGKLQMPGCTKPKAAARLDANLVRATVLAVNGYAPASALGSNVRSIVLLASLVVVRVGSTLGNTTDCKTLLTVLGELGALQLTNSR